MLTMSIGSGTTAALNASRTRSSGIARNHPCGTTAVSSTFTAYLIIFLTATELRQGSAESCQLRVSRPNPVSLGVMDARGAGGFHRQ